VLKQVTGAPSNKGRSKGTTFFFLFPIVKKKYRENSQHYGSERARQGWLIFSRKTQCSSLIFDSRVVNGCLQNAVQMAQAQEKEAKNPTRLS